MTTKTDRYGFPLRTCKRCGGSGHFSYNPINGTTCFGCGGTGWQHTPKAAKQYHEFVTASRAATRRIFQDLVPGDEVRDYNAPKNSPWLTVADVVITNEECGWSGAERIPTSWRTIITFTDGTQWENNGACLCRRRAVIDPAPYVAKSA